MSATRLLVLGAVIDRGTAHGYQVRKDLESWRADLWGALGQGSVYHALRQLTAQGHLAVAPDGDVTGPARTRYRPTDEGRREFVHLLESTLASDANTPGETMAAIGFLPHVTRPRAIELLEARLAASRAKRDRVAREYEANAAEDWAHHVEAVRFWTRTADAEIAWTEELVQRLRAGEYELGEG